MQNQTSTLVLTFGIGDPVGAIGIQADLATFAAMGCHGLSVLTALSVGDTTGTEDLQAMSRAIRWGDADTLHAHFTRTRAIRRGIVAAGQESAEPNFGRDRGKH